MLTIAEAQQRLRAGQLSPRELTSYCLGKIAEQDDQLRAWVLVDEEGALQRARELEDLGERGQWLGPLHGIPLGVKDIFDLQGFPTLAGSSLRDGHVAQRDAPIVTRMREAGAIVLGKTVTTQFACFDPAETRNPCHPDHTPGGSSSGSAAAVAAGHCLVALGSQTGGSIIRPASYCGIAGLMPTMDRWSTEGVVPVSSSLDHVGPLAPTALDLALVWQAVEGGRQPGVPSLPKMGVVSEYFMEHADEAVRTQTQAALSRLAATGAETADAPLPGSFAEVHAMHWRVMAVEAAQVHRDDFERAADSYQPKVAGLIQDGLTTSHAEYQEALGHQVRFRDEMRSLAGRFDALVMPSTPAPAPADRTTTGDPSFNSPWTYAGLPVVTLPCGNAGNGLPCGLQLVGRAGADGQLLEIAVWCESVLAAS